MGFGGTFGIYGNYSHDNSQPLYGGWSSSVTVVLGGGAAASTRYLGGGIYFGVNNSSNVSQLDGAFVNGGRAGFGALSVSGYRSPDGSVSGGGVTIGPSVPGTVIYGTAGGSYTWTLGGGTW